MNPLHLFEGFGVELEYMLVDRDTLAVKPITDELLKKKLGAFGSDFENGMVTWSNELVLHVVELKSTRPEADLETLEKQFVENITEVNKILASWNAMLMPSAAHPFMDPQRETRLWPHDSNEVYEVYNRIFDCKGHGWSNLQSTHLNLPFADDDEFAKLHAAIRVVLPLLPALCASSPILDGRPTGFLDTRMNYYKTNQARIPSITGQVIPEPVFSAADYQKEIYKQIQRDIAPFDPDHILNPVWVNSRGAMARFDRGSIEIRIMDIQECAAADLTIVTLVVETLKSLVDGQFFVLSEQKQFETDALVQILEDTVRVGQSALIQNREYLSGWGLTTPSTALDVWKAIVAFHVKQRNSRIVNRKNEIDTILKHGTLADRMMKTIGPDPTPESIQKTFRNLSVCLAENKMFIPK